MQSNEIVSTLQAYVASEILGGKDIGLDANTPLLEWGVVNSFEITRLLAFINARFQVQVPAEMVVADHFRDLTSLGQLVKSLAPAA